MMDLFVFYGFSHLIKQYECVCQGMALSAAENQKRYTCRARHDADPERKQEYLTQEKEKCQRDRNEGRKKSVSDLL